MLTSEFLLSCVPLSDAEFRSYLEQRSPQGESVIEHMTKCGTYLEDEREAFEKIQYLRKKSPV